MPDRGRRAPRLSPDGRSAPSGASDIFELDYPEETNAPHGLAEKMTLVQYQAYRQQHGFDGIFLLPVNLGSGMEISIKDLAELIAEHVGYTGEIVWDTSKPNGQPRRKLDVSRAEERFGFKAEVPFDEGIRRTVEWWETSGRDRG